ncbi:hypothetical protein CBW65_01480 [Tumebacillus avium]|uniref:DUF4145 domain-containing protein n=1 Tax=Tumebacillus avium TaxID=1903704 RepID=A0A1Y0IKI2_9BACL|nr:DUF4145 domain-containing protein [Tumebacillus avium]ARU59874.1 hypothetical protein CBW65_01480 [Tumebacillus avium]
MEEVKRKVYCSYCKGERYHRYIERYDVSESEDSVNYWSTYGIIRCLGCKTFAFLRITGDSETWDFDDDGEIYLIENYAVYPEPPQDGKKYYGIRIPRDFTSVPKPLLEVYQQVLGAFNSQFHFLCAIGLRSVVEALCVNTEITDGYIFDENGNVVVDNDGKIIRTKNLKGKINGLIERELITKRQAIILHDIRNMGNKAVHEIQVPKIRVLLEAIEIIEHVFHTIYELGNYEISPKSVD